MIAGLLISYLKLVAGIHVERFSRGLPCGATLNAEHHPFLQETHSIRHDTSRYMLPS
jgi:hypothetical protein